LTDSQPHFYRASESLRLRLKEPLGELISDSNITKMLLQDKIFRRRNEFSLIASVGDRTSERLYEFGFAPDLEVVDNVEKRRRRANQPRWLGREDRFLRAVNPPGGIDSRALDVIRKSLDLLKGDRGKSVRILIDGEEDLLVLPIVVFQKGRSMVLYGQPDSGLVLVDSQISRNVCSTYLAELGIIISG